MTSSTNTAAKAAKDLILSNPSTYHQWFANLRGAVPNHLWPYFDPEYDAMFVEPVPPIEPVNKPVNNLPRVGAASGTRASAVSGSRAATETPEQQTAREAQYEKRMEPYFKRHTIYRDNLRQWEKYNECEAKLRERILGTVAQQKAAPLVPQNTVRKWLIDLKASTEPPKATVKQSIRVEYQRLMSVGFVEWPTGGPNNWLANWEDLVYRAKQYDEPLLNWLTDVSMVWQQVPDLNVYFKTVEIDI